MLPVDYAGSLSVSSSPERSKPPIAILTADQERLRGQLRAVLGDLDAAIAGVGATVEDRAILAEAVRGLDELFLLVVVGEFNARMTARPGVPSGYTVLWKRGLPPRRPLP